MKRQCYRKKNLIIFFFLASTPISTETEDCNNTDCEEITCANGDVLTHVLGECCPTKYVCEGKIFYAPYTDTHTHTASPFLNIVFQARGEIYWSFFTDFNLRYRPHLRRILSNYQRGGPSWFLICWDYITFNGHTFFYFWLKFKFLVQYRQNCHSANFWTSRLPTPAATNFCLPQKVRFPPT